MDVSKNRGTWKWMVYSGKPHQNGWFWGTIILGNTHIHYHNWIPPFFNRKTSIFCCQLGYLIPDCNLFLEMRGKFILPENRVSWKVASGMPCSAQPRHIRSQSKWKKSMAKPVRFRTPGMQYALDGNVSFTLTSWCAGIFLTSLCLTSHEHCHIRSGPHISFALLERNRFVSAMVPLGISVVPMTWPRPLNSSLWTSW